MKIEKSVYWRDYYTRYIRSLLLMVESCKLDNDQYIKDLTTMRSEKSYQKMPHWAKSYVEGVKDTLFNQMWHEKLEGMYLLKKECEDLYPYHIGKVLNRYEIGIDHQPKWSEIEYVGQFWKGTNKPFSLKEEE